jgi:transcriptional regulator with XRE-family HTH domain
MSPEQCRAARGWLAWTQADLAERAKVGLSTVKDYEAGRRMPVHNNLEAIRKALEAGGMIITEKSVSGPIGKT